MAEKPVTSLTHEKQEHFFFFPPIASFSSHLLQRKVGDKWGIHAQRTWELKRTAVGKTEAAGGEEAGDESLEQREGPQAPAPGLLGAHPTRHGHIRPPGTGHEPIPTQKANK